MSRLGFLLALVTPLAALAEVPTPTVEGPVTGGHGVPFAASTTFDPAEVGYVQEEYFVSGTATAYTNSAPLGSDGAWSVTPGATAPYKTRILVDRPAKKSRFHGTVVVEWFNVTGGLDASPDWTAAHVQMIREGMAWVGVSAQFVGVEGGGSTPLTVLNLPLKTVDPARYGSLSHPGDSFSYDMFSQVAALLRHPAGSGVLGGFVPKHVVASGDSQSAFRLVTYANAIQPVVGLYDGFLLHSRSAGAAPLSEAPQPAIPTPSPAFIRTDTGVPVLTFQTETDPAILGSHLARQPDTQKIRLWEVAGTSHVDAYTLVSGLTDVGDSPAIADLVLTSSPLGVFVCAQPINSGPEHFVLGAAFHWLNRWIRHGTPPPIAPRFDLEPGPPLQYTLDAHGNVVGGVRSPEVDVPIATFSGTGQTGTLLCLLFGTTEPFDAATLHALYPKHRIYTSEVDRAANRATRAGFLMRQDARLIKKAAADSTIGD